MMSAQHVVQCAQIPSAAGALPAAERAKVIFTHLNHTNPAADKASPAARRVRAAGMRVASERQVLPL